MSNPLSNFRPSWVVFSFPSDGEKVTHINMEDWRKTLIFWEKFRKKCGKILVLIWYTDPCGTQIPQWYTMGTKKDTIGTQCVPIIS